MVVIWQQLFSSIFKLLLLLTIRLLKHQHFLEVFSHVSHVFSRGKTFFGYAWNHVCASQETDLQGL